MKRHKVIAEAFILLDYCLSIVKPIDPLKLVKLTDHT